jgi:hypothetical protein
MEQSPIWEATSHCYAKNLPTFQGTGRFIMIFTRAVHWPLSWGRIIPSTLSYPIYPRPVLILSYHLRLGLPNKLSLSGFLTISYIHSSSHACYMSGPSHNPWLDNSNYIWRTQVTEILVMLVKCPARGYNWFSEGILNEPKVICHTTVLLRSLHSNLPRQVKCAEAS